MAEILSINWEERARGFFRKLDDRRAHGKFDFTIIVEGQRIYAERNVLACGSEYFDAMFSHDTEELQKGEVEMLNVDYECVKTCIDFIYGKEVSVPSENYEDMMFAAHMMRIKELCDAVEANICAKLNVENFFTMRKVAIMFSCCDLHEKSEIFAEENFETISQDEQFLSVDKALVERLVSNRNARVNEERKLKVALQWVRFDGDRKIYLLGLLKSIDLGQISRDVGQTIIDSEPIVNTNATCLRYFSLAVMDLINSSIGETAEKDIVFFDKNASNLRLLDAIKNEIVETSIKKPDAENYSVVKLGDHIYCLGEDRAVSRLKYSEKEADWQRVPDMCCCHGKRPPTTVYSGCIYVIGSSRGAFSKNAVERYDPTKDEWTRLVDRPESIKGAEILGTDEYIYSFGGDKGTMLFEYTDEVLALNMETSSWIVGVPLNEKKSDVSATKFENKIYVAGGYNGKQRLSTLEIYDPRTDQWTMLLAMHFDRAWFRLFVSGRSLIAVCGYYKREFVDSVEVYDMDRDRWKIALKDRDLQAQESIQW